MYFLVTYDLNKVGQDYSGLIKHLQTYTHVKPMKSVWFIKTGTTTASEVYNKLAKFIDKNDQVLVMEIHHNRQGWLPQAMWDFLNK